MDALFQTESRICGIHYREAVELALLEGNREKAEG
jgi:hypothetical protein